MDDIQIVLVDDLDAQMRFEQHFAEVLTFVQSRGHASSFEIMNEFHVSYAKSCHLMDTLEVRDIVDVAEFGVKGPRPLLTEKGKILKRKRQEQEREEKQRERERPKPKPEPVAMAVPSTTVEQQPVRKRSKLRK